MITGDVFCYWDCQSLPDTLVVISNMMMTLILLYFASKVFLQSRQVLEKGTEKIYILLIACCYTLLLKNLFGILVYFLLYMNYDDDSKIQAIAITRFSVIYQILESIPALLLQALFFLIPYIMQGITHYRICNTMKILQKNIRFISNLEKKWKIVFKVYNYLRIVIIVPLILNFYYLYLAETTQENKNHIEMLEELTYIKTYLLIFDSIICGALLIYAFIYFSKKFTTSKSEANKAHAKFKKQCYLLATAIFFRLIMMSIFYLILPMKELKENCIGSEENQIFFTVGFLFIGVYSMYFLPIWTITNMYKVS